MAWTFGTISFSWKKVELSLQNSNLIPWFHLITLFSFSLKFHENARGFSLFQDKEKIHLGLTLDPFWLLIKKKDPFWLSYPNMFNFYLLFLCRIQFTGSFIVLIYVCKLCFFFPLRWNGEVPRRDCQSQIFFTQPNLPKNCLRSQIRKSRGSLRLAALNRHSVIRFFFFFFYLSDGENSSALFFSMGIPIFQRLAHEKKTLTVCC